MILCTDYELLRNVEAPAKLRLAREPIRLAVLLAPEEVFVKTPILHHFYTVFIEDRVHDWDWRDSALRYYGSGRGAPVTLIAVYEENNRDDIYCTECGAATPCKQHQRKE